MANAKVFVCGGDPNEAKFLSVQRVSDSLYLQSSDGSFGASISHIPMVAEMDDGGTYVGYFEYTEDRAVWDDGFYRVTMGANTGTGTYSGIEVYRARVVSDTIMDGIALTSLAARNAAASLSSSLEKIIEGQALAAKRLGVLESKVDSFGMQLLRR